MTKTIADVISAHLEECGDQYDLRYSVSIKRLSVEVSELLSAAGFGLLADAGAKALEDAADRVMGPSDVPLDGATCRWIAMELRERAAEMRQG